MSTITPMCMSMKMGQCTSIKMRDGGWSSTDPLGKRGYAFLDDAEDDAEHGEDDYLVDEVET